MSRPRPFRQHVVVLMTVGTALLPLLAQHCLIHAGWGNEGGETGCFCWYRSLYGWRSFCLGAKQPEPRWRVRSCPLFVAGFAGIMERGNTLPPTNHCFVWYRGTGSPQLYLRVAGSFVFIFLTVGPRYLSSLALLRGLGNLFGIGFQLSAEAGGQDVASGSTGGGED